MPIFSRTAPSWRSVNPIIFWPSIQISPASGSIKPTRCLSKTLLPPPLRPMMARVSPVPTSRSTPRKISCSPIFFVNEHNLIIGDELPGTGCGLLDSFGDGGASIMAAHELSTHHSPLSIAPKTPSLHSLIARRVDDVEHHGKEKIANQNSQRRVHDSFSCCAADAHRAFACGQAFVATDEHDEYSETECF